MRKLLDAAMVAFDKRGYHATRVNDVVEIAKTSHGTFYLYFSNKEDLLRALVAEAAEDSKKVYESFSTLPAPGGTPQWEDVRGWVQAYSDLWKRYAPLFRVWPSWRPLIGISAGHPTHVLEDLLRADRTHRTGLLGS